MTQPKDLSPDSPSALAGEGLVVLAGTDSVLRQRIAELSEWRGLNMGTLILGVCVTIAHNRLTEPIHNVASNEFDVYSRVTAPGVIGGLARNGIKHVASRINSSPPQ